MSNSNPSPWIEWFLKMRFKVAPPVFAVTREMREKLASCSLRLRWNAENMSKQKTNPGKEAEEALPWGTVVWAKSKGYPSWPSLVLTKEDALAHGVKGAFSICFAWLNR